MTWSICSCQDLDAAIDLHVEEMTAIQSRIAKTTMDVLEECFPSRTCRERRQKMLKLQNLSIYLMVFEGFKPMIEPSQCTAISRCDKRCWPRGFTRSHHLHIVSEGHRLPASSQRVARVPGTPGVKGKGRPSRAQSFIWWWWWIRQLFQESCSREKSCRVTGGHAWENTQCLLKASNCSAAPCRKACTTLCMCMLELVVRARLLTFMLNTS